MTLASARTNELSHTFAIGDAITDTGTGTGTHTHTHTHTDRDTDTDTDTGADTDTDTDTGAETDTRTHVRTWLAHRYAHGSVPMASTERVYVVGRRETYLRRLS
jgi:hypothetical protein